MFYLAGLSRMHYFRVNVERAVAGIPERSVMGRSSATPTRRPITDVGSGKKLASLALIGNASLSVRGRAICMQSHTRSLSREGSTLPRATASKQPLNNSIITTTSASK